MSNVLSSILADASAKLDAIPALNGKVGAALGGRGSDPGLSKAPLPCAWVLVSGAQPIGQNNAGMVPKSAVYTKVDVVVVLMVPYASQADLIGAQMPLIEDCIASLRGSESFNGAQWRDEGFDLKQVNVDRMGYELHFSTHVSL